MKSCALIVTFNRLNKLKQCLDATIGAGFNTIIIVNNGSSDGTAEWLASCPYPHIIVLSLPDNTGGAGGFSAGLRYVASRCETEWVFLYDDDACPVADILPLFERVKKKYRYDAYCGKVTDPQGQVCRMNLPFRQFPRTVIDDIYYVFNRDRYVADSECYQPVSSLSFVGAILSPEFIKRNLGGLFPELFVYFDDVYFSYFALLRGETFFYFPEVIFIHDIDVYSKRISPEWKAYYLVRNIFLGRWLFSGKSPFGLFTALSRALKYCLLTFYQENKCLYITYVLKGVWHGLLNKSGRI